MSHRQPGIHKGRNALSNSGAPSSRFVDKERKVTGVDDPGTSIQVAIRCRRRSSKEVEEKSPVIVSTNGPKSKEVVVEIASTTSTFGVVTLPPTRTYPFDTVFGPEADQASVYQQVVAPMLEEVVQGYNCTLFAYGQTGTGKTYTMQGDLNLSPLGNPVANAGMMPRVLTGLFQFLETSGADFSVKISYVELYNEELRDLLASEWTAVSGRPGSPSTDAPALKIYDEASKRGVFIQGIEEVLVKNATDAIALLTKGSQRRQVAATKFNDHSSRSHAVFSITVHMKEVSSLGDDLLKVGKFHLVDLAGSENIGRSGAENKRAREAGMINQSLLTLGRVINALVEKSQHVPYRESKLTRLLQDSLGGRTKTKIIATISPAHCNIEETLSTLEYALRAKSIRNRPEVNQRMSRNALLKDYVIEIERLKADLVSARERNGMYFSNETWDMLSAEKERMQLECEASKKECDVISSQLKATREEFEQSMCLLSSREKELEEMKTSLGKKALQLQRCEEDLGSLRTTLEEETLMCEMHRKSEVNLDGIARHLRQLVSEAVQDLNGLFAKHDNSSSIFSSKLKAIIHDTAAIEALRQDLINQIQAFAQTQVSTLKESIGTTEQLRTFIVQSSNSHSRTLLSHRKYVEGVLQQLRNEEETNSECLATLGNSVERAFADTQNTLEATSKELLVHCSNALNEVSGVALMNSKATAETIEALMMLAQSLIDALLRALQDQQQRNASMQRINDELVANELSRLREQDSLLEQRLTAERNQATASKAELMQQISGLISHFVDGRQSHLEDIAVVIKTSNTRGEKKIEKFSGEYHKCADDGVRQFVSANSNISAGRNELDKSLAKSLQGVHNLGAVIKHTVAAGQANLSSTISTQLDEATSKSSTLKRASLPLFERMHQAKKIRLDLGSGLSKRTAEHLAHMNQLVSENAKFIDEKSRFIDTQSSQMRTAVEEIDSRSKANLNSASQVIKRVSAVCTQEEKPTGSTPKKRPWKYSAQWELTHPREEILNRQRNTLAPRSHAPGPDLNNNMDIKMEEIDATASFACRPPPAPRRQSPPPLSLPDRVRPKLMVNQPLRDQPLNTLTNRGLNRAR